MKTLLCCSPSLVARGGAPIAFGAFGALIAFGAFGAGAACVDRGPPSSTSLTRGTRTWSSHTPEPRHAALQETSVARVTLDCAAPARPISPFVYGTSLRPMRDLPEQWETRTAARRWGGNHTTRYNWALGNAWNTGKDWYFKNVDYDHKAAPAHVRFIEDDIAHGAATAITVPIIGWVAKDTTSYGFPVALLGGEQDREPGSADVGNGVSPRGALLAPRPPTQTSAPMPPEGIGRWVASIRARDLARGKRGVWMYILDNEPTLWSETHRDIHPEPTSYDELLQRTIDYGTAIRRADPDARIAGPALWGWTAYFGSGVDKAAHPRHPDRDRHGGVALLPWWLRETAAHERRTGVRLLDVVDVHFYPQGKGIGIGTSGETDAETSARRIRAARALWDPTYRDESWIGEPVELLPRLRRWIDAEHPGLGISIGEYNFGAEGHMSGGLAVAEALGRFGTEGVTSAFYWDYPPAGSPAAAAFRAYRDFDGKGSRFLDLSVPARLTGTGASVFASRDDVGQRLVLVVLSLDPTRRLAAHVDASSCGALAAGRVVTYTSDARAFVDGPALAPRGGTVDVVLPAYSITVLDLRVAGP